LWTIHFISPTGSAETKQKEKEKKKFLNLVNNFFQYIVSYLTSCQQCTLIILLCFSINIFARMRAVIFRSCVFSHISFTYPRDQRTGRLFVNRLRYIGGVHRLYRYSRLIRCLCCMGWD